MCIRNTNTLSGSIKVTSTLKFDANAAYLIADGLGGLGRSISRWLVERGARNIVLFSEPVCN